MIPQRGTFFAEFYTFTIIKLALRAFHFVPLGRLPKEMNNADTASD